MSKRAFLSPESQYAHKDVQLSQMLPIIQEVLGGNGTFSLTITGSSMWPTILGKRDQVTLSRKPEKLQRYDLPLYIRDSGQFVLHRIVAVGDDGTYTCCGDHQWFLEKGIRDDQVVGVVTALVRKGKRFSADNKRYCRYVRFWVWFLPFRCVVFGFHSFFQNMKFYAAVAFRKVFPRK